MASVDDVRSGVAHAKQKADEAIGALQQAHSALDEAQNMLTQAIQGSGQDEILMARNMLVEATENLRMVGGTIRSSIDSAESWAGRL
ncbi:MULTISPECIES: hypothetical protein [Saccharopolyspora]|uniref:WXG100 family type VII secretion target n=1 Tax=Saccharopolyspora gregorii TaxID=33914 RepID=A0ABP6S1F9_9PSEU|nr:MULTISPECIES: hypothetical protein [Saccharopolyspora]MCA1189153.1 hypothetical protein [Saccharopolyspora sp. 6T]MCA1191170.1 hypothetical protein [Saccharopolyspora sp. 6V]MCA1225700.1 hypothetical protein [Saccharopolyspora sp. 6M]MCA1283114.1 hypothetical protein [Saccharopolyspora sp. 7B]